ncbi:putative separase [Helianthus annuus]|nr:putative separase [Helianthus annuus]
MILGYRPAYYTGCLYICIYYKSLNTQPCLCIYLALPLLSDLFCLQIICKEVDEQKVLLSSATFRNVKENLGLLLEQELGAYRKIRLLRQNRSQTMRKTILKILSQVVYDEEDSVVHINMIRIAKVRGSGESGYVDLNECLQSLYKAKETMVMSENKNDYGSVCNTLAEAHCLRTFCNQEARPNSKGYMGFHSRVHELIIRAYKFKYKKHFSDKCLTMLHESMRHSLIHFQNTSNRLTMWTFGKSVWKNKKHQQLIFNSFV